MSDLVRSYIAGKNGKKIGTTPAICLINPKNARNIGAAMRAASCFGIQQVWFTGDRVNLDPNAKTRLPREERMKGYRDVELIQYDRPFDLFPEGVTPVAIEVLEKSEGLFEFEHPENPLYVFGPEDGTIPKVTLQHCHRFVTIPVRHCLNLAMAVGLTLYDRAYKRFLKGEGGIIYPGKWENRGHNALADLCFEEEG
jgi:tRNA(Leu) C34 or U34 (ribose-2'-O)-methylase TrmL